MVIDGILMILDNVDMFYDVAMSEVKHSEIL